MISDMHSVVKTPAEKAWSFMEHGKKVLVFPSDMSFAMKINFKVGFAPRPGFHGSRGEINWTGCFHTYTPELGWKNIILNSQPILQEGWKAHNLIFAFTPKVKNHNRNDYIVILHRMKQAAADQEKFLLLKTELPSWNTHNTLIYTLQSLLILP